MLRLKLIKGAPYGPDILWWAKLSNKDTALWLINAMWFMEYLHVLFELM